MKKIQILAFLMTAVAIQFGYSALSQQIADYHIDVKLIPEEKTILGNQILGWTNKTDTPVSELRFHLYLNAFKNNRTTFMKVSGGRHRGYKGSDEGWGFIEVKSIKLQEDQDLTPTLEYIQPDDGNEYDQTVMQVWLPGPVMPGESIALHIEFMAKLPRVFARSGYFDDFYMVAQWFPKIGVYENGEWNCHQYHRNSEFYADFATYEVDITLPQKFVVGATGKRIHETENPDGTKTLTYYQEDVHDFVWAACPDFVEFRESFSLKNPEVKSEIILLIHKSHVHHKDRYLESLKNALVFYSRNYGPYPYETITLVDPAPGAAGAGGMEYPTLFTGGTMAWLPQGLRMLEMVTVHEFGHQFWYGIVANNEFEEAWLDEGINSYSEIKAMTEYYGEKTSMVDWKGIKIGDSALQRFRVLSGPHVDPILKNSWEFISGNSYSTNVYSKAALMLLTLENHLGEDVMSRIMKTYFERWSFKHPQSDDFIAVAEEVSGLDLSWFFDQFLKKPGTLDYAVDSISCREVKEPEGLFDENHIRHDDYGSQSGEKIYRSEVVVVRKGEWSFPQDIHIRFENDDIIHEQWEGKSKWKRFVYQKPVKIHSAHIDPERKVLLDINFTNNSQRLQPHTLTPLKYALGAMLEFQKILSLISL
ncbi:MAG: M1 family metallopeptidase [Candidatus Aminicenantes bacterium]